MHDSAMCPFIMIIMRRQNLINIKRYRFQCEQCLSGKIRYIKSKTQFLY